MTWSSQDRSPVSHDRRMRARRALVLVPVQRTGLYQLHLQTFGFEQHRAHPPPRIAMFTRPPRPAASVSDSGGRDRSRTPAPVSSEPWGTGNPTCDEWIADQQVSPEVLHNFSMMPQTQRKRIVLGCMDRPPDNLDAWLSGCVRNWRVGEMERRLTATPTPQQRPEPTVRHEATSARHSPEILAPAIQNVPILPVSAPAPDICLRLNACWPGDKSALIASLMEVLDEDTTEALMELEPCYQAAVACTFMLTASQDKSWSSFTRSLVDRFLRRRGVHKPETSPLTRTSRGQTTAINVQFVLSGLSSIMAGTLMSVMQKTIPQMHQQIAWTFMAVIFLREGTTDNMYTEAVSQRTDAVSDMECASCEQLADKFEQGMEAWHANGTKFVFLANVAFLEKPDFGISDVAKSYLHQKPNTWLWTFLQASEATRRGHLLRASVGGAYAGTRRRVGRAHGAQAACGVSGLTWASTGALHSGQVRGDTSGGLHQSGHVSHRRGVSTRLNSVAEDSVEVESVAFIDG